MLGREYPTVSPLVFPRFTRGKPHDRQVRSAAGPHAAGGRGGLQRVFRRPGGRYNGSFPWGKLVFE